MNVTRRQFLLGGLGIAGGVTLAACGGQTGGSSSSPSVTKAFPTPSVLPDPAVHKNLVAKQRSIDLGGIEATTWGYESSDGDPAIEVTAGDILQVDISNELPESTSIHWHGLAIPNDVDGVPGITQDPIEPGESFSYSFQVPHAGTYFYHSHSGIQLDRGLHAPLIVRDPSDPGDYDVEWTIFLDDWLDGIDGHTPDEQLAMFDSMSGSGGSAMEGMDHSMHNHAAMAESASTTAASAASASMAGMHAGPGDPALGGDAGDLAYPHYLLNERIPAAFRTFEAKAGQKARLRFINAGADTIFKVALGGHTMTVIATDGYAVVPKQVDSFYLGMGERADVEVTLADGVFPLTALAAGKDGRAFAVVRTASGEAPSPEASFAQLEAPASFLTDLVAADSARLATGEPDVRLDVELTGQMMPYKWGLSIDGDTLATVSSGQRVLMTMRNTTAMAHPMHIHGHTWSLPDNGGLRKDTILILPGQSVNAELIANNPGEWVFHCHNGYHMATGMMAQLNY